VQLQPELAGLVDLGLVDLDLEAIEGARGDGGGQCRRQQHGAVSGEHDHLE
jgi:hypothetical protein